MSDAAEAIRAARRQRMERLLVPICERHGVTPEEVLGRRRTGSIRLARAELMTELWRSGVPLAEIGRMFGRDHTTVISNVRGLLGEEAYAKEATFRHKLYPRELEAVIEDMSVRLRVAS